MKRNTISSILKFVIAIATAIASTLGIQAMV